MRAGALRSACAPSQGLRLKRRRGVSGPVGEAGVGGVGSTDTEPLPLASNRGFAPWCTFCRESTSSGKRRTMGGWSGRVRLVKCVVTCYTQKKIEDV